MSDLDMAPADGATHEYVAKSATDHLGLSIDDAVRRGRKQDRIDTAIIGGTGLLGLSIIIALIAHVVAGVR